MTADDRSPPGRRPGTGPVEVFDLAETWAASPGEPVSLHSSDEPVLEAGAFVIEPGERVPETGAAAHDGTEFSVVFQGELRLGGPTMDREVTVVGETAVVIPAGVEHYSRNPADDPARLVYVVLDEI